MKVYSIPDCAWRIRLDGRPEREGCPRRYPIGLMLRMAPVLLRIRRQRKVAGRGAEPPSMFSVSAINDGHNQGVPIGGLGAGSIGRTYRGDFARWHLNVGEHVYHPSIPNQFHLFIRRDGERLARTLNPRPSAPVLSSWGWGLEPHRATYHALFPRAWTVYDYADWGLQLTCEQISPVIGHNYRESSYPVGVFHWSVQNVGSRPLDVSLMLTWENAIVPTRKAHPGDSVSGHVSERQAMVELRHGEDADCYPVSFGLGVASDDASLLLLESFDTEGGGAGVWSTFSDRGIVDERASANPVRSGHRHGAALCSCTNLMPGESKDITFAVAWDIPIIRFGRRSWYRRYTRFFGSSGDNALRLTETALGGWREWSRQIHKWQQPVLESDLPDWLKCALFNELYYLVDGGTAWTAGPVGAKDDRDAGTDQSANGAGSELSDDIGHFAYLECFDYPFYNTYDVHFYASFALLWNWPLLDNSIHTDFADAVLASDERERMLILHRGTAPRKPYGCIPHDLGTPQEDPWVATNAYNAQDVSRWKDLNTKFVLQVYRNYVITGDRDFLEYCWPSVKVAMEYADRFDTDGDGLIENEGFPDQTYDVWTMQGVSTYCAGLYLAAAEAMVAMAGIMNEPDVAEKYREVVSRGRRRFTDLLWTGEYFRFDSSGGRHSDSIMADMLSGLLYTHVCGLPRYVDAEKARMSLRTIFEFNVLRFADGEMGAVNGMRPNGKVDRSSPQSAEVWTGTTYALAALMAYEGLLEEAEKTAYGIYRVTYHSLGYWFRTPEAWLSDGSYRASMYMRPLAVWALGMALLRDRGHEDDV